MGEPNDVYIGGNTNYAAAFSSMQTALGAIDQCCLREWVQVVCELRDRWCAEHRRNRSIPERNALIAAGVDNISIEAIGGGVNAAQPAKQYCYPLPCGGV